MLLSSWPSVSLLLILAGYWLLFRLYAWRATLPVRLYVMFFTFGCVGSVIVSLYLQALPFHFAPDTTGTMYSTVDPKIWLTGPPIEEFAKAIPLLLLLLLPLARRLSIADFALIGFSTGLGFEFVEHNMQSVLDGSIASFGRFLGFGYSMDTRLTPDSTYFFAGHQVYTALIGVGAGLGVRFLPRRWRIAWLPAMLLLVYCNQNSLQ